jgi:hypothetical protein
MQILASKKSFRSERALLIHHLRTEAGFLSEKPPNRTSDTKLARFKEYKNIFARNKRPSFYSFCCAIWELVA